jgi:hypothetical protein
MRQISAPSLVFFAAAAAAVACVPRTPDLEGLVGAAGGGGVRDGGSGGAPGGSDAPHPTGPTPGDAASDRPRDVASGGGDARSDLGALKEAGVDGAREVALDVPSEAAVERAGRAPRAGELAITELLVDPAGNDLGHEWVEIANLTDDALDLATLRLADDATEFPFDAGILGPRALLVLGQSADRAHNGDAPVDRAYGTRLAFNNGADRLSLCAGPCAGGVVLASFAWTTASFGAAYAGRAVIVTAAGATCPATEPYGSGADLGTPGRPNPPCATQADGGRDGADR